ncbi:YfiT family bacillithiol transferase [Anditalea andensis]|uniref:DinB-like domain-containing protein n=1 Tax=Anditalea andensis TaxID=1048983 RepID=A0A074KWF2_9BACT|nr:putative metal-dependent hydrolase [Anditalea andensis]KEO74311.1 hypothetical protein EL17_09275 [Anditalea andensis]
MVDIDILKFPIGVFKYPSTITQEVMNEWISDIASFPDRLSKEVTDLTEDQLDVLYRPDGWSIRQVVHHCADSHMNSLMRLKLALTEEAPLIKPYFEDRWAELIDTRQMPIHSSLLLLEGIHAKWTLLLNNLSEEQYKRTYIHPEHGKVISILECTGMYAWHCNHHLAHITATKKSNDWK